MIVVINDKLFSVKRKVERKGREQIASFSEEEEMWYLRNIMVFV